MARIFILSEGIDCEHEVQEKLRISSEQIKNDKSQHINKLSDDIKFSKPIRTKSKTSLLFKITNQQGNMMSYNFKHHAGHSLRKQSRCSRAPSFVKNLDPPD